MLSMEVDLQKEARRGREAQEDLSLLAEHIHGRQQELFGRFVTTSDEGEVYELREEARALQRLVNFLEELTMTGQLAERQLEGERYE
jgi:hypothetical protein